MHKVVIVPWDSKHFAASTYGGTAADEAIFQKLRNVPGAHLEYRRGSAFTLSFPNRSRREVEELIYQ